MKENVAFALKQYFETQGMSQTYVANILGKRQPQIAQILSGKVKIGQKVAKQFADAFGFSETFLYAGVGSLFPDDDQSIMSRVNEEMQSDDSIPADVRLIKEQAKVEELRKQVDSLQEELREAYKTIARLEIRLEEQDLKKDQAIS